MCTIKYYNYHKKPEMDDNLQTNKVLYIWQLYDFVCICYNRAFYWHRAYFWKKSFNFHFLYVFQTSQYSKLEKADILEMTVKHLRSVQRQNLVSAATSDASVVGKYRAGFSECASEVTRYLSSVDGLNSDVHNRLLQHLSSCMHRVASPEPRQPHQQQVVRPPQTVPVSIPATQPIQIQIPMATQASSLPGAGVQTLQVAATALTEMRGVSPQHSTATYSPVGTPAYIAGAFQVIPGGQTAFMLPSSVGGSVGLVSTGTPIYTVNTASFQQQQQQQQQTQLISQVSTVQTLPVSRVSVSPSPVVSLAVKRPAQSHHCDSSSAVKRMMTAYPSQAHNLSRAVKVGISDTLREEKVWRPW